jgi:hypothetical protein
MKPCRQHPILIRRSAAWPCAVVLLLTGVVATAVEYEAGTAITDVSITNPTANEVWLAGSDHTLTCITSTDTDRCREDAESEWQDIADSVTHYWTGTGTFKDNDNIGTSVTYICTNTASNNTVTVYADDDYTGDGNTAIVDEAAKSDSETVSVIIPVVDSVLYVGDKNQVIFDVTSPEYNRNPARNEPSAYVKGQHSDATVVVKFWASTSLTESSNVDVVGWIDTFDLGEWGYPSGTFGTSWPTAGFSADITQVNKTSIGKITYTETWKYRCPNGSDTRITASTLSGRVMYLIYDDFKCDASLFTKANLDTCTGWANNCDKVDTSNDATNVARKVQLGAKAWYNTHGYAIRTGIKADPFTWIPANKGDCLTYADLMTKGCQVLGVQASTQAIVCKDNYPNGNMHWYYSPGRTPHWLTATGDADGDGTTNENEAGYPGTIDTVYVKGSDPDHDAAWRKANAAWNCHGASSVAGHWWEITFFSTPDHDTEANMCSWPNGPVIKYPGHLYPNGTK